MNETPVLSGALIAMSGGVDSSVAAWLCVEQGLDCVGGMMKLFSGGDGETRPNSCCGLSDAEDARAVARRLGIPFYVFNFSEDFDERVIRRFADSYRSGATPNPCIDCNRFLKFDRLMRRARELEKEYIVTGHYARIEFDAASGRYLLKKGADASKDQSYVLYAMTQEQLAHTLFPLGGLSKSRVREIAQEQGFVNAKKPDSQDICFVQNGGYADFIRQYTGEEFPAGRFTDAQGQDLGEHRGIINYTVGQRRGLGVSAARPLYVREVRPGDNTVVLGGNDELYGKTLTARDINLIAVRKIDGKLNLTAKIRYRHQEQPASVWQTDEDTLRVEFDTPQRAITRGQALVLYDGETVVGGGTIDN